MATETPRDPPIVTVRDVARAMVFAKRNGDSLNRTVFLIGAGCSISAGIPDVKAIARRMVRSAATRLHGLPAATDAVAAHAALVRSADLRDRGWGKAPEDLDDDGIDWHLVYDEMFEKFYRTPDHVRVLFGEIMSEAGETVNWAHLCLGELVTKGLVSTVLTTNFDQLVLTGMVLAGVLPVMCDGIESLDRISPHPRHPQLVELHGSRHAYRLRNHPDEVEMVRRIPGAIEAVRGLLHEASTFVVVGYGGREDGVMDLLVDAAKSYPDKNLFWIQYSDRPDDLSAKAKLFLATSRNAGQVLGQDADVFFLDLCRELKVGAPTIIGDPLAPMRRALGQIQKKSVKNVDIAAEIAEAGRRTEVVSQCLTRDAETRSDPAADLRELRLAGRSKEAYAASLTVRASLEVPTVVAKGDASVEVSGGPAAEKRSNEVAAPRGGAAVEPSPRWDLIWEAALAADMQAETDPEIAPRERAVALWRELTARDDLPDARRLEGRRRLGAVLMRLGERSPTSTALEESISVLRDVSGAIDRVSSPLDWAAARYELGCALWLLGQREGDPRRLTEAINILRGVLEIWTRDHVPLDWARAQNNLGNALSILGRDESGTESLRAAVEAYRAALLERTRDRVPLEWASTQDNLGGVFKILGERESGTESLLAAVEAHRAALLERPRDRVPRNWATTQYNLGLALTTLGARTADPDRWQEAEAALRLALEVLTPEAEPYWNPRVRAALDRVVALRATLAKPATEAGRKLGQESPSDP